MLNEMCSQHGSFTFTADDVSYFPHTEGQQPARLRHVVYNSCRKVPLLMASCVYTVSQKKVAHYI